MCQEALDLDTEDDCVDVTKEQEEWAEKMQNGKNVQFLQPEAEEEEVEEEQREGCQYTDTHGEEGGNQHPDTIKQLRLDTTQLITGDTCTTADHGKKDQPKQVVEEEVVYAHVVAKGLLPSIVTWTDGKVWVCYEHIVSNFVMF